MTPFEEALASDGAKVAAWDLEDSERMRLALYSVGPAGAKFIAHTDVPLETHEDMVERILDRNVRIGATYAGTSFVWVADEYGFAVWSDTALTASGRIASPAVAAVQVFYDVADRGHRGVRLKHKSGGHELIAEEHSKAAKLDITYGQDNLFYDTFWAQYLGEHLAIWHLVPLENDIQPGSIEPDLIIATGARALAREVSQAPATGSIPELVRSLGPVARASELSFRFGADPDDESRRMLAIRVRSPSGKSTADAVLKRGSNEQIAGFLRRVTTPAAAQFAMNDLIRQQLRSEGK